MQTEDVNPSRPTRATRSRRRAPDRSASAELGGVTRELCMPGAGDPQDTQTRGEAALTGGRLVRAGDRKHDATLARGVCSVRTTSSQPWASGRGCGRAVFRIKQVTHVINAAEHYMDAALETNSLGT